MRAASACVLLPQLVVHLRDVKLEQAALYEVALWAHRFTPAISLHDPDTVLLEIGASLRLFGGLNELVVAVKKEQRALGLIFDLACAPTPLAARWLVTAAPGTLLESAPEWTATLDELPLGVLALAEQVDAATIGMLRDVGLRSIGELRAVSRRDLARRGGQRLVRTLARARGELADPQAWFEMPEKFDFCLPLPVPTGHVEAVLFAIRRLAGSLAGWLAGRHVSTGQCMLSLTHESTADTTIEIVSGTPLRDAERVMLLVRERLASCALPAPVTAVRLSTSSLENERPCSAELFDDGAADIRERAQWLEDRLRARFGAEAVFRIVCHPDHRPERAWRRVEPERPARETGIYMQSGERPLWLLAVPRRLASPALVVRIGRGERIESGWWDGAPVRREYFRARHRSGALWWVFHDLENPDTWYVHGYFG